mgnify:CR=1 FL=1
MAEKELQMVEARARGILNLRPYLGSWNIDALCNIVEVDLPKVIAEVRRLREALERIEKMPCLSELLGEPGGYQECGCAHCQAREALKGEAT